MINLSDRLLEAACYWERKRIVYNGVLLLLTIACWGPEIVPAGPSAWLGAGMVLLAFAMVANVLFCLAYPVDLAIQLTPLRTAWSQSRWLLFVPGLLLACTLALWVMLGSGMA